MKRLERLYELFHSPIMRNNGHKMSSRNFWLLSSQWEKHHALSIEDKEGLITHYSNIRSVEIHCRFHIQLSQWANAKVLQKLTEFLDILPQFLLGGMKIVKAVSREGHFTITLLKCNTKKWKSLLRELLQFQNERRTTTIICLVCDDSSIRVLDVKQPHVGKHRNSGVWNIALFKKGEKALGCFFQYSRCETGTPFQVFDKKEKRSKRMRLPKFNLTLFWEWKALRNYKGFVHPLRMIAFQFLFSCLLSKSSEFGETAPKMRVQRGMKKGLFFEWIQFFLSKDWHTIAYFIFFSCIHTSAACHYFDSTPLLACNGEKHGRKKGGKIRNWKKRHIRDKTEWNLKEHKNLIFSSLVKSLFALNWRIIIESIAVIVRISFTWKLIIMLIVVLRVFMEKDCEKWRNAGRLLEGDVFMVVVMYVCLEWSNKSSKCCNNYHQNRRGSMGRGRRGRGSMGRGRDERRMRRGKMRRGKKGRRRKMARGIRIWANVNWIWRFYAITLIDLKHVHRRIIIKIC